MALARIITRSQVCARELAADLLARGYTVEIVTPDSVPGNSADLELRVEESSGNQLVASVHTHDGPRSASFEFRHQLRAPIADFLRTMQETTEVVYLSADPVNPVAHKGERVEWPEQAPKLQLKTLSTPAPGPVSAESRSFDSPAADANPSDSHLADSSRPAAAPLIPSLAELAPSRAVETVAVVANHFAQETEAVAVIVPSTRVQQPLLASINASPGVIQPRQEPQARNRTARWEWRAALAFIGMVSVAIVLGLGIGRSEKTSPPFSREAATDKTEVPSIAAHSSAAKSEDDPQEDPTAVSGQRPSLPSTQSPIQWGWDWDHTQLNSAADNAEKAIVKASIVDKAISGKTTSDKTQPLRQRGADLIARDTITYFVGRHQPRTSQAQPANGLARPDPAPHKHGGGVVAANTVTYLNKPIPKPAK